VPLRQSYARVGKLALIKQQRYAHAKQFERANKCLRRLKTYLGRVTPRCVWPKLGNNGMPHRVMFTSEILDLEP
jgi:transposase, IS5 family